MKRALMKSLKKRFEGIFVSAKMSRDDENRTVPFSNAVYVSAACLDPKYKLYWVEEEALLTEQEKAVAKADIKSEYISAEVIN